MNTVQVLQKAKELISDPRRWIKGNYAKDSMGNSVFYLDIEAECFCAAGAILHAGGGWNTAGNAYDAFDTQTRLYCGRAVPAFNDLPRTTHADVLYMFDKAIEAEKEQAS